MAELSWSEPWIANAYINNSDWNRLCTYTLLQLRRHIIHINSYIELVSIFYVMFVVFVLSHQFCCKTLFAYELANCYELCITGERNKSSSLVEFVEWSQIYSSTPWYISYQLVSLLYLSYSAVYMTTCRVIGLGRKEVLLVNTCERIWRSNIKVLIVFYCKFLALSL
jgi:hypothetical protein